MLISVCILHYFGVVALSSQVGVKSAYAAQRMYVCVCMLVCVYTVNIYE